MQHKENFAAVNLSLKDICNNEEHLFGGVPVILGGDFAQTLPIVPRGSRGAKCNASIRHSTLWSQLQVSHLKINMRVQLNVLNQEYAKCIAEMSYHTQHYGSTELPPQITHRYHRFMRICFPPS